MDFYEYIEPQQSSTNEDLTSIEPSLTCDVLSELMLDWMLSDFNSNDEIQSDVFDIISIDFSSINSIQIDESNIVPNNMNYNQQFNIADNSDIISIDFTSITNIQIDESNIVPNNLNCNDKIQTDAFDIISIDFDSINNIQIDAFDNIPTDVNSIDDIEIENFDWLIDFNPNGTQIVNSPANDSGYDSPSSPYSMPSTASSPASSVDSFGCSSLIGAGHSRKLKQPMQPKNSKKNIFSIFF